MDLSSSEIRVLGCLLEKQRTTPDHYPLSLNSLRLACNQATNRDPVVDYDEAIIRDALHRLERRGYTRLAGASRAAKYRHLLSEALPMSSGEQAVMCVLMLRGPQTPGELKQRGERIHVFDGLGEVHSTLAGLIERHLVVRLERRPGQKEERYEQLLGEDGETDADVSAGVRAPSDSASDRPRSVEHGLDSLSPTPRISDLTERVTRLEQEMADLRDALMEVRGAKSAPTVEAGVRGAEGARGVEAEVRGAEGAPVVEQSWSEQMAQPTQ
jgi:uncharacterized protein YceH (UPF0502 family)